MNRDVTLPLTVTPVGQSVDEELTVEPRPRMRRLALRLAGVRLEVAGSWRLSADMRSFVRLASDALLYRADRIPWASNRDRSRTVELSDGTELTYRPNRGDVRAIAETWMARAYELPFEMHARNVLDLGTHIGAAGVWLMRRYGGSRFVGVEPVPENARLARQNLEQNAIAADVVTAAAWPHEGRGRLEVSSNSTLGKLGDSGIEVPLVTPQSLVERFPVGERIDLVKIDIEGAEQEIFTAGLEWLTRVDCLVLELHAHQVDWRGIIHTLERLGFAYSEIGERNYYKGRADLMAAFRRPAS